MIDISSAQQIVESADPVPSVAVAFQDNPVFAGFVSATVVLSKKIDQQLALCQSEIGGQRSEVSFRFVELYSSERCQRLAMDVIGAS